MELLRGDEFENLFRTFERSAFHLELKDSYDTSEERGPFALFLAGKPDDFAWHEPWLSLVRETTQGERSISRVRIVSVPHTDYTRWGLTVTPLNIEAGEDIRWLPRDLAKGIELPVDDFWLFDDSRLVFTVFETDGQFVGGVEVRYPEVIELCRTAQRETWGRAIPHAEYVNR
jgi:hypothetical protein